MCGFLLRENDANLLFYQCTVRSAFQKKKTKKKKKIQTHTHTQIEKKEDSKEDNKEINILQYVKYMPECNWNRIKMYEIWYVKKLRYTCLLWRYVALIAVISPLANAWTFVTNIFNNEWNLVPITGLYVILLRLSSFFSFLFFFFVFFFCFFFIVFGIFGLFLICRIFCFCFFLDCVFFVFAWKMFPKNVLKKQKKTKKKRKNRNAFFVLCLCDCFCKNDNVYTHFFKT